MTDDWQLLLDIFYRLGRLDHPLYRTLVHDDYPHEHLLLELESALRSGEIPMLGCRVSAFGLEVPEHIETKINADAAIEITLNEVTLRNRHGDEELSEVAVFKRARADLESVERWLRENVAGEPRAAGDEAQDHVEKPLPAESAQNKVDALAAFVRQRYPTRPPKSVEEFMKDVKNEASHIGKFKKRTFESALAMAYPQP
jgi:hypothetical protein